MRKKERKLLLLFGLFLLCLCFSMDTQAAKKQFKKPLIVMKEGQTKTLILKNSTDLPEVVYHDANTSIFEYQVKSRSRIKVTAVAPGIESIFVSNGPTNISCTLVVMPKKNPAVKKKTVKRGTAITYEHMRLVLPKAWKQYGYVVLAGVDSISFHAKSSYQTGYYGTLFSIEWCPQSEYAKRVDYLPNFTFLRRYGPLVYYLTYPTDVQFNTKSKKCAAEYQALEKTLEKIRKSIRIK